MGGASSVSSRRYDYSATSYSDEDGGKVAVEKALSLVKIEESKRRNSCARINYIAKPQYSESPFNHYTYEKQLGEGAFSKVFRAIKINTNNDHDNGKKGVGMDHHQQQEGKSSSSSSSSSSAAGAAVVEKYAVKEIMLKTLSKHQLQNMEREVQILSQLDHPDVVKMHAVYRIPNQLFLVLEYLRGGELLKAICQRKRYTEDDARSLLRPILEGVRYLHSRDVIHRDIKPENLILSNKSMGSMIKIVDFGFACLVDRDEEERSRRGSTARRKSAAAQGGAATTYLCGTPGYLAPEVISSKYYSTACDMWSVGVVTYILLSGTMPFSIRSHTEVLAGNFSFPDDRWSTVSPAAKDLICKLLTVDPSSRYTAENALEHEWLRSVGVLGVSSVGSDVELAADARKEKEVISLDDAPAARAGGSPEVKKRKSRQAEGGGHAEGAKVVKSHDSHGAGSSNSNGSYGPGDLTGNIPSIRQFTAMRKFHRSMNVVTATLKFRGAGLLRERRRSEASLDVALPADMMADSRDEGGGAATAPRRMSTSDVVAVDGPKVSPVRGVAMMMKDSSDDAEQNDTPRADVKDGSDGPPVVESPGSSNLEKELQREVSFKRYADE